MNIGDIVIYDRFGDRFASVAPTMDEDEQDVGLIVSEFFLNDNFEDEMEGMSWTRVLTSDGQIRELALCYLAEPNDVSFSSNKNVIFYK